MGVYIENMEKPKSCYNHCLEGFIANEEIGCPLKDYTESHQYKDGVHPDCPLIDIVTCGECKHWYRNEPPIDEECNLFPNADDFCPYGERREDERGDSEIRR